MMTPRLRHRVDIESYEEDQDSITGEITRAWVMFIDGVPAEVMTGPGSESRVAASKHAETTARIVMRWFPGLLSTHRIVWEGKLYDILSIETDATGRRDYRVRVRDGLNDGA